MSPLFWAPAVPLAVWLLFVAAEEFIDWRLRRTEIRFDTHVEDDLGLFDTAPLPEVHR